MTDLLERLEAAEEGSRELDCLIAVALHEAKGGEGYAKESPFNGEWCAFDKLAYSDQARTHNKTIRVKPWSTSVDAALTLVPEKPDEVGNICRVILERKPTDAKVPEFWLATIRYHAQDGGFAAAKTAPLAICIAALRARQIEEAE